MSNGARHVLGVVAGLLLPPLVAAGVWYGVGEFALTIQRNAEISWLGLSVLAVSGLVFAFLAGSRLSPIASLLGGLGFTALGVVPVLDLQGIRILPDRWLPAAMESGFQTVAYSGVMLFFGVALLAASMFPSRWRSRVEHFDYLPAYDAQAPYLPQSGPEDATRPMYRE
ncbi:hypothetical protein ITP53_32225 [Nonomuraea sp. K274]|uniref:Uncharacterized protein n=1 Tax=Nonomuraea cypriaca TaxID=1187855 RepID=A0A931ACK7_9ACTN|nr:hypothetical protein [Nonomuraea cypriaca]MBF8190301.1 hypothetical protein [Nonomuraea cypriaca]